MFYSDHRPTGGVRPRLSSAVNPLGLYLAVRFAGHAVIEYTVYECTDYP